MNLLRSFLSKASCVTVALAQRPHGSATVEFAFIAPVLALFLGGIIEVGSFVQTAMLASNAAREGARYAALGDCAHAVSAPTAYMASALGGRNVSVGSVSLTPSSCPPAIGSSVKVSLPVTVTINMPVIKSIFGSSVTVTGSSTMQRYTG